MAKSGYKEVLKRLPVIIVSLTLGSGLIVFGLYWIYYLYTTDAIDSLSTWLPTLAIVFGALLVYLPFEGITDRHRNQETTLPLPPPPS